MLCLLYSGLVCSKTKFLELYDLRMSERVHMFHRIQGDQMTEFHQKELVGFQINPRHSCQKKAIGASIS